MRVALMLLIVLTVVACGGRPGPPPEQYRVLRTYGWESTVSAPQAEWNLASYMVLVRATAGLRCWMKAAASRSIMHPAKGG